MSAPGPAVLNRHHLKGAWPAGAIYVGRGTILGNPYVIDDELSREAAIDRFEDDLKARISQHDPVVLTALVGAARATGLICSCVPARCHAELVRKYAMNLVSAAGIAPSPVSWSYAGIGSRRTPPDVLRRIRAVAARLAARGFSLRSGGADGADTAFEDGAAGSERASEIFLPHAGFNGRTSVLSTPSEEAVAIASAVHPLWSKLGDKERLFHARNSHQVLGADLRTPVDFVVAWTADGAECEADRSRETGGTGQAIALADRWRIPVFNLARADALDRIKARIGEIESSLDRSDEAGVDPSLLDGVHFIKQLFPGSRVASAGPVLRPATSPL